MIKFKPLPPITCDTRLTIGMPRYLRDALRSAAEANGQTVTDFARVAIAEHMALTTRPRRPLFAAVKSSIKEFSSSTVELSHLGKEVGLTIDQLRTLQSVGAKVNLSSDEVNSSAAGLANAMEGLRRGRGPLADFFRGQKDFGVREEGQRLQKMARETKDAGVYLRESIKFLQSIPDPVQKQVAASALGISGKFGRMSLKEYDEYTKRAADRLGKTTPQMLADSKRYEYALQDLGDTADRLRLSIGAALLPAMSALSLEFEKFVSENREGIKDTFLEIGKALKSTNWKWYADGVKETIGPLKDLIDAMKTLKHWTDLIDPTQWLWKGAKAGSQWLHGGDTGPKTPSGAGGDWLNGGAFNRGDYTGRTLSSILKGGPHSFYGPARSGLVEPRMQSLKMNHAKLAKMMRGIDSALAGSNVLEGATDQGSLTDPNGRWMGGRKVRDREVYNDWGGGPGGHEGARRYRERLMEGARVDQRRARETESLARRSRENGLVGTGAQKIEGDASLKIDFQNMPRGTRVSHEASGMFKNVHVNRGRAMGLASEDG